MSMSDSCKDGSNKSINSDGVCDTNNKLHKMSLNDTDLVVSVCANCGKEGRDVNNICNKCKKATYCNAACKKKHRHKHKKECEQHVAELHDKELFKQPPDGGDCPICFIRMPTLDTGWRYQSCCGKVICSGCVHAPLYDNQGNKVDNQKCPFCRTPWHSSDEESVERLKKRIEIGDPVAMHTLGCKYRGGIGLPQDYTKALELYHQAGELGFGNAYTSLGYAYSHGRGVEIDKVKANHYYELAAKGGHSQARHNLGNNEWRLGNMDRALKHWVIAIQGGRSESLDMMKQLYALGLGHATKEDYTKALQLYQAYLVEIKSSQRDKAAAADEEFRYY